VRRRRDALRDLYRVSNGDYDAYWHYHLDQEHHRVHHAHYHSNYQLAA
jgi:hypothetical protein